MKKLFSNMLLVKQWSYLTTKLFYSTVFYYRMCVSKLSVKARERNSRATAGRPPCPGHDGRNWLWLLLCINTIITTLSVNRQCTVYIKRGAGMYLTDVLSVYREQTISLNNIRMRLRYPCGEVVVRNRAVVMLKHSVRVCSSCDKFLMLLRIIFLGDSAAFTNERIF